MGMTELSTALRLIADHPALVHLVGPRPEELVAWAEQALNVRFPPTYRTFLRQLGADAFGSVKVYGVCDDDWEDSGIPDMVWLTLTNRRAGWLPERFIHIADDGMGGMIVLDLGDPGPEGEPRVKVWETRFDPGDDLEVLASDFGTYLLAEVEAELRRSRSAN
jgi:hypothetical protein